MILTNLNAVSQYERMRRRQRPIIADIEDPGDTEASELVEDDEGTHGVPKTRRKGEASRRRYLRRRLLLAPERRRWPRNGNGNRELGRIVDTYA
jgi:hypothetical protein